jgi:hypothetical protein
MTALKVELPNQTSEKSVVLDMQTDGRNDMTSPTILSTNCREHLLTNSEQAEIRNYLKSFYSFHSFITAFRNFVLGNETCFYKANELTLGPFGINVC